MKLQAELAARKIVGVDAFDWISISSIQVLVLARPSHHNVKYVSDR